VFTVQCSRSCFSVVLFGAVSIATAIGAAHVTASVMMGDHNADGHVDLADFAAFQRCYGENQASSECGGFDYDGNGRISERDYARFRECLLGPDVPGDPTCGAPADLTGACCPVVRPVQDSARKRVPGGREPVFRAGYDVRRGRPMRLYGRCRRDRLR